MDVITSAIANMAILRVSNGIDSQKSQVSSTFAGLRSAEYVQWRGQILA